MENFLLPDQVARLHRSQLHIEMHLGERLRLNRLARAAAFSPFHYHRLFKRMTGESVCAHLGRVRLERAAFELVFSRHSVLDIAMGHGFTSPEAFARAFRRRFGTSPRAFRSSRTILNEQRDFVSEWRREFAPLQPDWRTEPPQRITFLRRQGPLPVAVSAAWEAMSRVLARSGAAIESERIGCTPDYPGFTPPDRFRFDMGVPASIRSLASDEMVERVLPGGRYAVFHLETGTEGSHVRNLLWHYLYVVWAPSKGIEIKSTGAYEVFRRAGSAGSSRVELHVPVK